MFEFYLITWRKFYGYTENAARLRLYKINKKFLGHISFRSENDTDDGSTRCQFFLSKPMPGILLFIKTSHFIR